MVEVDSLKRQKQCGLISQKIMLTVHSATSVALISCKGRNDERVLMLFSAMCFFIYYSTFSS